MTTKEKNGYTEMISDEGKFLTQKDDTDDKMFVLVVQTRYPGMWEECDAQRKEEWELTHQEE